MNTGGTCTCTSLVHTVPYKQSRSTQLCIRQHRARAIISPERHHLTRDGRLRAAAGPRRRFGVKEE